MSNKQLALFDRILELEPDERRVLGLAMPPLRRFWPTLTWGLLWAISVVALLAPSAYLITRASLIIHILWLGIAIVAGITVVQRLLCKRNGGTPPQKEKVQSA